jgi:hypothetical protein
VLGSSAAENNSARQPALCRRIRDDVARLLTCALGAESSTIPDVRDLEVIDSELRLLAAGRAESKLPVHLLR